MNSEPKFHLAALRRDSELRSAPPGTSPATVVKIGGIDLRPKPLFAKKRLTESGQYLTNANPALQSVGVLPT